MIREINAEEFKKLKEEKGLLLVDFYSPTCGPCKMLAHVLEDIDKGLEGKNASIVKINYDENFPLARELEIPSYPTMLLLKDGEEIDRVGGLQPKPAIEEWIADNL